MEAPERAELQIIKNHYEKALECLSRGLQEDEFGNKDRALLLYRLGRRHVLQGLAVATPAEGWDSARHMQLKMRNTLSNITTRLAALETTSPTRAAAPQPLYPSLPVLRDAQTPPSSRLPHFNAQLSSKASGGVPRVPASPTRASEVPNDIPPAYTPKPTDGHLSISHRERHALLCQNPLSRQQTFSQVSVNEPDEVLLFIPNGVQIFFVAPDGQVSAPSYPGFLRIILDSRQRRDDDISDLRHPPACLQVCDWHYPLFPDSPVLLSNTGVFTFPDTTTAVPGSYVGLVLSPELPASDHSLLQEHLSVLTQLRVQEPDDGADVYGASGGQTTSLEKSPLTPTEDMDPEQDTVPGKEDKALPEWSEKMSQSILAGCSWLSRGLVQGGDATGKAIQKGAVKLREHITPEETPAEVGPRVTQGLQVAKQATGGAAKVSQFLVDGLSTVVDLVGKELGPHVKKQSSKLIPGSLKNNKGASANMGGAKVVAVSSLKGLSTIWTGLETAAKTVGKSASSETVLTVKHKLKELENILIAPSNI
ncbi:spartin a isoform X2 [Brachyhypopomus gauderio]|uniref:spartin a isoform X2 n=1 Tax=Brachyhypopomus gauderio TaxID=698409 RepID=UPI004042DA19